MKLSVVIRCKDDPRVFDCIKSIDENVEMVVSMTPNQNIQNELKENGIKFCLSPVGNLSKTSNIGIENTSYDKVIITDSDTIFRKGCIKKLYQALDDYQVVRARIIFQVDNNLVLSKTVAELRDYVNTFPVTYTPGLGIRKGLAKKIGGFYFNDPVPWAVDADLNHRIKKANIPFDFLEDAYVYHRPIGIKHDLKAAFRIGMGKRVSVECLNRPSEEDINCLVKRLLRGDSLADFREVKKVKGRKVALYSVVWKIFYHLGYHYQKLFHIYD